MAEQDDSSGPWGEPASRSTTTTTTTTTPGPTSLASSTDTALAAAANDSDAPGRVAAGTPGAEAPPGTPAAPAPSSSQTAAAPSAALLPAGPPAAVVAAAVAPLSSDNARQVAVAALGMVRYDWSGRLPGWTLHFADGRSGYRGLTFIERRAIEVYVRPGDTPERVAQILAHEIGHAVDLTYLDPRGRAAWLAARGLPASTLWYPGMSGESDFATGAGDFAESFAWLLAPQVHWSGRLASPPTFAQGLTLAVLIGGT